MSKIYQWFVRLFTGRNLLCYVVKCKYCSEDHKIKIDPSDVEAWQGGQLIQDALSYLNKGERELLISRTCNKCFGEMFGLSLDWDE